MVSKFFGCQVKLIQAAVLGRNPKIALGIDGQPIYDIIRKAVWKFLMREPFKCPGAPLIPVQTILGGNPDVAVSVLNQVGDHVVTDTLLVFGVVSKGYEFIAIITVQPVAAAYPHKSAAVLQNTVNIDLRQPLLGPQVLKTDSTVLGAGQ